MAAAETARLIASLELQDKFTGPARSAEGSLDRLEGRVSTLGRVSGEMGRGIGVASANIARLGAAATIGLVGVVSASVRAASDLNEEIDKSNVVFGNAADSVQEFATASAAIGLSKAEALGAAGAFGNMFNTIGLGQKDAADMSVTMVQLAADMASFNNEDPSEMLLKLRSGLAGEAEPLRRYGVLLSEAAVKEFAVRKGIVQVGQALTEAQKVQARYGLILEQSAIQQGNFADTSTSLANQQRILKANLANTGATIGTALLPQISKLAQRLNDLVIANQPVIASFAEKLPGVFDRLIGVAENLPWGAIGKSFELMGTGADALLTAFTSLPGWVQTAVLTGWGLNKLTGGALGNIAGMLGKAAFGQLRGATPANPVFVKDVGLPGGPGGGGKLPFLPFGLGAAAAIATPLILSGSDNVTAEMENKRLELVKELNAGIITAAEASRLWAEAFGRTTSNPFISGSTPLGQFDPRNMGGTRAPVDRLNTVIQPLLSTLEEIKTEIREQNESDEPGNFVPGVKLDPSRINDIRTETAQSADYLNELRELLPRFLGGLRQDTQDTKNSIAQRLAIVSGGINGANVNLSAARTMLGIIAAKDFSPRFTVQNNVTISATLLEQRLVSARVAAVGAYSLTGAQMNII